jgi:hypothetical protein
MPIWFVLIVPHAGVRWVDSYWITEDAAKQRKDYIAKQWVAMGNPVEFHKAYVCEAKLENAELHTPEPRDTVGRFVKKPI